jgi:hypothetical protein
MTGTIFLFLAGLAAFGFLFVVWQQTKMPALLRVLLIIAALAIVAYVGWILFAAMSAPK